MVKRVIHPARAKLVGAMKNLHTANAQVGYFQEQGQHSSGFSYSALMYLHEVIGVPAASGKVYRRLFEITMMLHRQTLLEQTKKNLYKQLNSLNTDPSDTLEAFAKSAQKAIKRGFGNTAILPPNAPSTVKRKASMPLLWKLEIYEITLLIKSLLRKVLKNETLK
ncbi:hypothetical protein EAMBIBNC_00106 [Citrobacter phage BSwM KMM4]|nr:hypothetical protein EAMBIBNC_00106 [Citrobacter phage BSwM KMM4]